LTTLLPPGNYSITSFLLEKNTRLLSGGGSNTFRMDLEPSSSTKFVVKPGVVTNLGRIVWAADAKTGSQVISKESFAAIKTQFGTQHAKSLWLGQPWQEVKISRNLDFDIDNAALANQGPAPARTAAQDFHHARIEALVRTVPANIQAERTSDPSGFVTQLVAFLSKGSPNQFETVKRLHDWVADNIAYDAPSFLSGKLPDQGYEAVLKTKLAVCEGYATLFKKLCDTAGIPCALVAGYSRGYGATLFAPEDPTASNHAWNLVQIDHQSYLIDTTWDAGVLDGGRYSKTYSTGYLFADPAEFIHSHFPENPQYQLLASPVSASDFTKLPSWNAEFFSAGVTSVSKLDKINQLGSEFSVTFRVPSGVDLMGVVFDEHGKEYPDATFRQQKGDTVTINAALPQPGQYILRLFKHQAGDQSDEYAGCGEIGFTTNAGSPNKFPKVYSSFVANDELIAPLGTPLVTGKTVDFKIVLPQAALASVVIGKDFIMMTRDTTTGTFTASVLIPQGTTNVGIATSRNSGNSWESLLDFPIAP
jgi:transglutaminase/protease-like cytokinesis protein 3